MSPHITRFVRTCAQLAKESVVGRPSPALRRGEGGFADWVILSILCLREREEETFRSVVDKLRVMGPIRAVLGLELEELPDPSTVCKAMDRFTMALFRRLLDESVTLFELGDVTAIDASGFDRIAASRRYARRTDYRFLAMKTALLTDCESGAILDLHCTTSRPHDTQIGWQVLTRNLDRLSTVTADKGFDWADLRTMLRENGVRPLIKHREFASLDKAHNARLDDDTYHRRSVVECSFRVLKQRYGDRLTTRTWFRQFRELTLKAAVKNIDTGIGASHC
jgi:IS5 family transposase